MPVIYESTNYCYSVNKAVNQFMVFFKSPFDYGQFGVLWLVYFVSLYLLSDFFKIRLKISQLARKKGNTKVFQRGLTSNYSWWPFWILNMRSSDSRPEAKTLRGLRRARELRHSRGILSCTENNKETRYSADVVSWPRIFWKRPTCFFSHLVRLQKQKRSRTTLLFMWKTETL